jgi:hypothetical protein
MPWSSECATVIYWQGNWPRAPSPCRGCCSCRWRAVTEKQTQGETRQWRVFIIFHALRTDFYLVVQFWTVFDLPFFGCSWAMSRHTVLPAMKGFYFPNNLGSEIPALKRRLQSQQARGVDTTVSCTIHWLGLRRHDGH